jgi:hypothetical protein
MVILQENNKINYIAQDRQRPINYFKEKMKYWTSFQVFSTSVADALLQNFKPKTMLITVTLII